jgi:hypothetical protein
VIGRHATLLVWGALGLITLACQFAVSMSKGRLPSLLAVVRRLTSFRLGRWILVLGWMWLGWHSFAR